VRTDARRGRLPVLFLAATHDLVLDEPDSDLAAIYRGGSDADPWPAFRELVDRRRRDVADRLQTRSVQTNEVGRSALLAPALRVAAGTRPVALVELGPSAGLNLFPDRYRLEYCVADQVADGVADEVVAVLGDPTSPVTVGCALVGPHRPDLAPGPTPSGLPDVVARTGVDPNPLDVADPADRRWLRACLWPGVPARAPVLAGALDLVAPTPPDLRAGDAADALEPLVAEVAAAVGPDALVVVVATWALTYLPAAGREAVLAGLDRRGADHDLALVTFEEPRCTPWVPAPDPGLAVAAGGTATVLGLRTWTRGVVGARALAYAHPHGRRLAWAPAPED